MRTELKAILSKLNIVREKVQGNLDAANEVVDNLENEMKAVEAAIEALEAT
jgi:hypothetical protein